MMTTAELMKTVDIKPSEYLSNDILEKAFLKVFAPFHFIQWMLGSCRVDARDQFVTTPSKYQKIYTIFIFVLNNALMFLGSFIVQPYHAEKVLGYLVSGSMVVFSVTYSLSIVHVRFFNSEENKQFHLRMHEIDRSMRIKDSKVIYTILFHTNARAAIIVQSVLTGFILLKSKESLIKFISIFGYALSYYTFVVEIGYCSNLLMYFCIRVRFINSIISNHILKKSYRVEKLLKWRQPTKAVMRYLAAQTHDFSSTDTDINLREIFDCFGTFQDIYKFQVLVFFVSYFINVFICFEFGIIAIPRNIITFVNWIDILILVALGFVQALFLCFRCESFFKEVKETRRLSIAILSKHLDGPLRRKAKSMLKTIEEAPPRFSVYDMWYLDASVIIKVASLMTSLLVTLLQFAYL